jgi:hypothetical protein
MNVIHHPPRRFALNTKMLWQAVGVHIQSQSVFLKFDTMRILTILLVVFTCTGASAEWVNKQGSRLPEATYRKSIGDFVVQMVFVEDERELLQAWGKPSESVNVKDVASIAINHPINTFIVFGGCKPDNRGNCSVVMRFRVIAPDGKVYSETPTMQVWHEKPLPPNRSLQLSVDYLKIVVEPHEQHGKYVVHTEVRDNISGDVLRLQKSFTASESTKTIGR